MSYDEILSGIEVLQGAILEDCILEEASALGLDPRCGELWVCPGFIASKYAKQLDYYGGFEYVHEDFRLQVGELTIYLAEDDRVSEHLQAYVGAEK